MSHNILITGASGGFGLLSAKTLLQKGHKVAATVRDPAGRNREVAAELEAASAFIVDMDVSSDSSVELGVAKAIAEMGHIDTVVNNAGVGVLGVQETFTIEDFKRLFEINVFGVQRVNRAVLPGMRERGSGLLLHVSSLLGRVTIPFYGPYNASKWAVEALAENYRQELAGFGVDSCIVEPGGFPTSFMHALIRPSDKERETALGDFGKAPQAFFDGFEQNMAAHPEQDPQLVADAIAQVIETPAGKRPMRTAVDKLGMGAAIEPYNQMFEQVMDGMFAAFGMSDMRGIKS